MTEPTYDTRDFDEIAANYLKLQQKADQADADAKQAKSLLMTIVEHHGAVPRNAEASRRIEGARFVATITTGTTVEVNDATVTELELVLSSARYPGVFSQMFSRRVEYSLVKDADLVLKQMIFRKTAVRDRVVQLYSQCFSVKRKTPSLKVEPVAHFKLREEKAAKKAARTLSEVKKGGR